MHCLRPLLSALLALAPLSLGLRCAPTCAGESSPSAKSTREVVRTAQAATDEDFSELRGDIHKVLELYRPRMLNTRDHGAWEIMHAIVAYGVETQVRENGPEGNPVTAIGWLCFNRPAARMRLFYLDGEKLAARTGRGLQGHHGQFLAMMAQAKLKDTYPLRIEGKSFTIRDLVRYEQETCRPKSELTFKLIGLMHYLDSDAGWLDRRGRRWSLSRLIREELAQPIRGAPCGGTHRLFALSYAVHQRAKRGEPIDGEYARAKKYIEDYHRYTFHLQNPDGSFSTEWFRGRGAKKDIERRLQTTGHILEWLVFSLPEEQLRSPRVTKSVRYLTDTLSAHSDRSWPVGYLGHALHALSLYDKRLGKSASEPEETIAKQQEDAAHDSSKDSSEADTAPDEMSAADVSDEPIVAVPLEPHGAASPQATRKKRAKGPLLLAPEPRNEALSRDSLASPIDD